LYHFIGKDIIYFHSLFWPALLEGSGFRKPNGLFVHGYVTVDGLKMSKSRGNFITAQDWLNCFDSDSLRYYFATKLSTRIDDINVDLEDFMRRVNTDIVNKIVNLVSRCTSFIHRSFGGKLSKELDNPDLYDTFISASTIIGNSWERREFNQAIRKIMELVDLANRYIDTQAPWKISKINPSDGKIQSICSMGINLFRIIITWLKPVLPSLSQRAESFLRIKLEWYSLEKPLLDHNILPFKKIYNRIEHIQIDMLREMKRDNTLKESNEKPSKSVVDKDITETISLSDLSRVDMRIVVIEKAELVENSNKLLRLVVDLGYEKRQIFSGIRKYYPNPSVLVGKKTVAVINLSPRKMRFGVSEAMILSAGSNESGIFILSVEDGAQPGMRVY
jgi:methionyl-tRNA synthetase